MEVKKKKNKRDKKTSGQMIYSDGAAASASESLPQDATPASGKAPKKEAGVIAPLDVSENTADIPRQTPKKKKAKAKNVIEVCDFLTSECKCLYHLRYLLVYNDLSFEASMITY